MDENEGTVSQLGMGLGFTSCKCGAKDDRRVGKRGGYGGTPVLIKRRFCRHLEYRSAKQERLWGSWEHMQSQ